MKNFKNIIKKKYYLNNRKFKKNKKIKNNNIKNSLFYLFIIYIYIFLYPYPLDGGGPAVYIRYIFWCFEPEKMYGTFFISVIPKYAVHFFRYQKKMNAYIFFSSLKIYNAYFQVQRKKSYVIKDFRNSWNKAAPHTPPPPTKHMFYKVLQWWKSGFIIVYCNMF